MAIYLENEAEVRWEVWLSYPSGVRLGLLDFALGWQFTPVVNGEGYFNVLLPVDELRELLGGTVVVPLDAVVEFRRGAWGQRSREVFTGMFRKPTFDRETVLLEGKGLNHLLKRRHVLYAAGSAEARKTAAADDFMKAVVRENLGASAGTGRSWTGMGFEVAADVGLGPSITRGVAWDNVFAVCQELSQASVETGPRVFFEVQRAGDTTFRFVTSVNQPGQDRTGAMVPFGVAFGTLENPVLTVDRMEEVNTVTVAGGGQGAQRLTVEVAAAWAGDSPWNRCEGVVDRRDTIDATELTGSGNEAVNVYKPRKVFSGELTDSLQARWVEDWNVGDRVTVTHVGDVFEGVVMGASATVNKQGEALAETVRGYVEVLE